MKTDAEVLTEVNRLIDEYHPKAGLDSLSKFLLSFSALRHPSVKMHMARVALIAHNAASNSDDLITPKPAFFGGLFHDIGKLVLPDYLFSGREVNEEEYAQIKEHAVLGFEALKDHHFYTALCAGMHHAMGQTQGNSYGINFYEQIIKTTLSPRTALRVLQTSLLISIADFADAFMSRKTTLRNTVQKDLKSMLIDKYGQDANTIIDLVLDEANIIHGNN